MQFTQHHFATHRDFPAGLQALAHLAERKCSHEIIENGGFLLVEAVTFFPWDNVGLPNKYLRVVPRRPSTDRIADENMMSMARSLTWIAPNAIPVAICMTHASASGVFEKEALRGLCNALDNLCGYRIWTKHERRERYLARRMAKEDDKCSQRATYEFD